MIKMQTGFLLTKYPYLGHLHLASAKIPFHFTFFSTCSFSQHGLLQNFFSNLLETEDARDEARCAYFVFSNKI